MRKHAKKITGLVVCILSVCVLVSCIPPFIENSPEMIEGIADELKYTTYELDNEAEGGYVVSTPLTLNSANFLDENENNVTMRQFYSITFTFAAGSVQKLDFIAFIVFANKDGSFKFQITNGSATRNIIVDVIGNENKQVSAEGLGFDFNESLEVEIRLQNPVTIEDNKYRLDSFIFI